MKKSALKILVLAALTVVGAETLRAQPTASPSSFNFVYQVNSSTLPTPGKLTATMSTSAPSGYTLTASVSPPMSWLTVTPGGGSSPLALTVTRHSPVFQEAHVAVVKTNPKASVGCSHKR